MSLITQSKVIFHEAGAPTTGVLRVGSAFPVVLVYVNNGTDQLPISLADSTLEGRGEWIEAKFDDNGKLIRYLGQFMLPGTATPRPTFSVPVTKLDQVMNKGQFSINTKDVIVPDDLKNIDYVTSDLPTAAIFVRISNAGNTVIDQPAIMMGYRRGWGSMSEPPPD